MNPLDPQMFLLLYFVLPVWLIAGFADWICHRATDIETTTGLKETYIHILMFLEMSIPLLSALFLDVNALVILSMIVFFSAMRLQLCGMSVMRLQPGKSLLSSNTYTASLKWFR
ncbi:MAG: hypothetical protein E6Z83_00520 [Pantoea sp.]|uniref:hypothetical protein n=1 Tax=Pantoea TaxID=53335 RepID=UPI001AD83A9E|nr:MULTISPECIES: hypothetical protein [Pantoea]MDU5779269.1 hypothetical protein [Pantoea sp.]